MVVREGCFRREQKSEMKREYSCRDSLLETSKSLKIIYEFPPKFPFDLSNNFKFFFEFSATFALWKNKNFPWIEHHDCLKNK